MSLKIHRVNKSRFQVRDGKKVVRECVSFKDAMNAVISEDLLALDCVDEFCDTELEDLELMEDYREVA